MARLPLDQNLSHRILDHLSDLHPGSTHVRHVGLARATDLEVWTFAREAGYMIVSKDGDFHQMSFLFGPPPKVVWLRLGNCSTDGVIETMLRSTDLIAAFAAHPDDSLLVVGSY